MGVSCTPDADVYLIFKIPQIMATVKLLQKMFNYYQIKRDTKFKTISHSASC